MKKYLAPIIALGLTLFGGNIEGMEQTSQLISDTHVPLKIVLKINDEDFNVPKKESVTNSIELFLQSNIKIYPHGFIIIHDKAVLQVSYLIFPQLGKYTSTQNILSPPGNSPYSMNNIFAREIFSVKSLNEVDIRNMQNKKNSNIAKQLDSWDYQYQITNNILTLSASIHPKFIPSIPQKIPRKSGSLCSECTITSKFTITKEGKSFTLHTRNNTTLEAMLSSFQHLRRCRNFCRFSKKIMCSFKNETHGKSSTVYRDIGSSDLSKKPTDFSFSNCPNHKLYEISFPITIDPSLQIFTATAQVLIGNNNNSKPHLLIFDSVIASSVEEAIEQLQDRFDRYTKGEISLKDLTLADSLKQPANADPKSTFFSQLLFLNNHKLSFTGVTTGVKFQPEAPTPCSLDVGEFWHNIPPIDYNSTVISTYSIPWDESETED